jgi:hypothetical protein
MTAIRLPCPISDPLALPDHVRPKQGQPKPKSKVKLRPWGDVRVSCAVIGTTAADAAQTIAECFSNVYVPPVHLDCTCKDTKIAVAGHPGAVRWGSIARTAHCPKRQIVSDIAMFGA